MFGQNKTFGMPGTSFSFNDVNATAANPFGQTAFGNKAPTPSFGSQSFGNQTPSLFGTAGTATAAPLFGSTGFGQANVPRFGFGATATTSTASPFSQTPQVSGGNLFGASTSTFGQTKTAFGAAPGTSGFGTGVGNTSGFFGAQNAAQPVVGQQQVQSTAQSLFGQPSVVASPGTTNLFGTTAFGTTGALVGTTVKFNPPTGTDTMMKNGQSHNISTRHQCITCMKEYDTKSLEELRMEDYSANRKGQQVPGQAATIFTPGAAQAGGGLFGTGAATGPTPATVSTSGLFGAPQNKSMFGTAQTGFGTGFFNQAQNTGTAAGAATGGFFGKAPTVFGNPAATSTTTGFSTAGGLFGAQPNKTFGVVAPQSGGGLFGSTPQQGTSAFGTGTVPGNTVAPGAGFGVFGSTQGQQQQGQQQQQIGLFNAPKTNFGSTLPGSTGLPGFNQATQPGTTQSLFGQKTQPFGSFGTTSSTAPGLGGTGGLTFGASAPASTFFSQPAKAPGLGSGGFSFGQTPATGSTGLGGGTMFSAGGNKTGMMFGSGFSSGSTLGGGSLSGGGLMGGFGSTLGGGMSSLGGGGLGGGTLGTVGIQEASSSAQQQILALASSPFGDSPLFRGVTASGRREEVLMPTNPTAQKAVNDVALYKVSPRITVKIKPRPVQLTPNSSTGLFDGFGEDDDPSTPGGAEIFVPKHSVKRLVIRPQSQQSPPNRDSVVAQNGNSREGNRLPEREGRPVGSRENSGVGDILGMPKERQRELRQALADSSTDDHREVGRLGFNDLDESRGDMESWIDGEPSMNAGRATPTSTVHPAGITLRRPGYYTIPSLEELAELTNPEDGSCLVEDFTIGRQGYGSLYYDGPLDVSGLDLDKLVHLRLKEVVVYPDDQDKPPEGEGLNRPAQVTLDRVWPMDKTIKRPITNPERLEAMAYEEKLVRTCAKLNSTFVEYRPETGSWVFRVKHFSKYGITAEDEEEDGSVAVVRPPPLKKPSQLSPARKGGGDATAAPVPPQPLPTPPVPSSMSPSVNGNLVMHHMDTIGEEDQAMEDQDRPISRQEKELSMEHIGSGEVLPSMRRNIQMMKASFFADESDEEDMESETMDQSVPGSPVCKRPSLRLPELSAAPRLPAFLAATSMAPSVPKQSTAPLPTPLPLEKPVMVPPKHADDDIPLSKTLLAGKQAMMADAALFHGRAFRVGWGAGWTLTSRSNLEVNIMKLQVSSDECLEQHLEAQLSLSVDSRDPDNDEPFKAKHGPDPIHSHYDIAQNSPKSDPSHLAWGLAKALWGRIDQSKEVPEPEKLRPNTHAWMLARKRGVGNWLEGAVEGKVEEDRRKVEEEGWRGRSAKLTGHQLRDWCEYVDEEAGYRAALLITQSSSMTSQRLVQQQMGTWAEAQADRHMPLESLRTLALAAGIPVYLTSDDPVEAHPYGGEVNTCAGLDWKRCLGVHLWYITSPASSLPAVLREYERAFRKEINVGAGWDCGIYATPPLPPHLEEDLGVEGIEHDPSMPYDLCFHMLKLFGQRSHPLQAMLQPNTHTRDPVDFRTSWHLHQALMSLGYGHIGAHQAANLHCSFAAQLEASGLWWWAAFVVLHLPTSPARDTILRDLLGRHVSTQGEENIEEFLQHELHIPAEWIFEAKATRASSLGLPELEAWFWLKAGRWTRCHDLLTSHVGPSAVVQDNRAHLAAFLNKMALPQNASRVAGWANGGLVFWEYLQVLEAVEHMVASKSEDAPGLASRLGPKLGSLVSRVMSMKVHTPKEHLCQAEMAKRLAHVLRAMFVLAGETGEQSGVLPGAELLAQLPLPEDYALQELRHLSATYSDLVQSKPIYMDRLRV